MCDDADSGSKPLPLRLEIALTLFIAPDRLSASQTAPKSLRFATQSSADSSKFVNNQWIQEVKKDE
jgi:hypothetical protein